VVSDAVSPDMPVVYVNAKFEEMSGYSSAEMLGRNCRHLQGAESGQTGLVAIRQAIREKTNGYAVLRNFRKDGSLFINELFISPIRAANGEVTHFLGIQHLRDADFAGRST
jgi:PAS domain S-box-containing protein